jgi:hypothetical protein
MAQTLFMFQNGLSEMEIGLFVCLPISIFVLLASSDQFSHKSPQIKEKKVLGIQIIWDSGVQYGIIWTMF